MPGQTTLKLGTLGGAGTFAGEATARFCELYPEFDEPVYFHSMEDCWEQLTAGAVDAIVLGTERTGQLHHGEQVIAHDLFVLGSLTLPLNCFLYAKPGTRKENIRKIVGHGSIAQCTRYLDREFPGIPRERHGKNSFEAAKDVMAGNGDLAVVGSRSLPNLMPGLSRLADGIDDGAISSWWAVTSKPYFVDRPACLMIAGRFGPNGQLGDLIAAILSRGYRLETVAGFAANEGVSIYDYLLRFAGEGERAEVERTLGRFPGTRLVGAFNPRAVV